MIGAEAQTMMILEIVALVVGQHFGTQNFSMSLNTTNGGAMTAIMDGN